ncbi:uncharacterized protein [Palaemon carinicauda]|uniref:uncharacterized protein n=1 Tax=Palaemon carinicauda TaxID=392227 RepID=UPI0035B5A80B
MGRECGHNLMEALYVEVLYTVFHKVGAQLHTDKKDVSDDLPRYAQTAFHIDMQDHLRLQAVAQEEKPPILVLNLVVVEAENLEAKDPNGFSDPYCMMGIVPEVVPPAAAAGGSNNGGSRSSSRQNSLDSFSDPYCMLGIQPAVQSGGIPGSPRDIYTLAQGSPPPDSPRVRAQVSLGSRSSVETESDNDLERSSSCESPKGFSKDSLRKHHSMARLNLDCLKTPDAKVDSPREKLKKRPSFRLSFKRKPAESKKERMEHRDSLSNAIPAKIIRATSVKPHTLNPRWCEKFRLDIDDINYDILHLDIWDHDDESSVFDVVSKLNEVKGVKGLGRFFKQIAQSARQGGGQDDFLGCVNIPLQQYLPSPASRIAKVFQLSKQPLGRPKGFARPQGNDQYRSPATCRRRLSSAPTDALAPPPQVVPESFPSRTSPNTHGSRQTRYLSPYQEDGTPSLRKIQMSGTGTTGSRQQDVRRNGDFTEIDAAPFKLSSFASGEDFAWFECSEFQFCIKGVTRSTTKADYVLVAIPEDTFPEIYGWLCEQGDTPIMYDALKAYHLQQFVPSPAPCIANLFQLSKEPLGDQRASPVPLPSGK